MKIYRVPFADNLSFHLSVGVLRNKAAEDDCDVHFVNQDTNAVVARGFVCLLVLNSFPRGKALPWKILISVLYGLVFLVSVNKKAFFVKEVSAHK